MGDWGPVDSKYHGLGSNQGGQHASPRRAGGTKGHPDVRPRQQPAVTEPLRLLGHLGRGKLQNGKTTKTSILSLSQLEKMEERFNEDKRNIDTAVVVTAGTLCLCVYV